MRYTAWLTLSLFVFIAPCVLAQQQVRTEVRAEIREMVGTVEVMQAGSEAWTAAKRGQTLALDTVISTGFRSTAVIALGDSLITMRPLTRLTVLELSQSQNSEKVELNLQTGRVKVDVKTPEGGNTDFTIHSPNSTSSVRGTLFELDTLSLSVIEGTVEFSGISGASKVSDDSGVSVTSGDTVTGPPQLIDAGGFSQIDEYTGRPSLPTVTASTELSAEPPIGSEPVSVPAAPASAPAGSGPVDFTPGITF